MDDEAGAGPLGKVDSNYYLDPVFFRPTSPTSMVDTNILKFRVLTTGAQEDQ